MCLVLTAAWVGAAQGNASAGASTQVHASAACLVHASMRPYAWWQWSFLCGVCAQEQQPGSTPTTTCAAITAGWVRQWPGATHLHGTGE